MRMKACTNALGLSPTRNYGDEIFFACMAAQTIDTPEYILYPSPRNEHRVVFEHQCFVSDAYALIHLPDYDFDGKATLFAAHRKADGKNGQLVTCELEIDILRFERLYDHK